MTDGSLGTAAAAAGSEEGRQARQLPARPARQRGLPVQLARRKVFRKREAVLGDIVNSQPVYVGQPFANYQENNYAALQGAPRGRRCCTSVRTTACCTPSTPPSNLLDAQPRPGSLGGDPERRLAEPLQARRRQLQARRPPVLRRRHAGRRRRRGTATRVADDPGRWPERRRQGLLRARRHEPGRDADPAVGVQAGVGHVPAAGACGMPAGIYADCNLGLTFGKPIITKLGRQLGRHRHLGLQQRQRRVTGDGGGYRLRAERAHRRAEAEDPDRCPADGTATPSGLAQINNYVDNVDIDNTTLRAYGGDVLGNIWRFDFLPQTAATLLGHGAKDAANNVQPITIRPELAELDGKPFVMVGTGKSSAEPTSTDCAEAVGVRHARITLGGGSPIYADRPRTSLRPMAIGHSGRRRRRRPQIICTGSAGDCGRPDGWVLDLPEAGERVNVEMKLVSRRLVFASNVPEDVPCSVGGHSWFNQIDFRTGAPIPGVRSRRSSCPIRSTSASTSSSCPPLGRRRTRNVRGPLPADRRRPTSTRTSSRRSRLPVRQADQLARDRPVGTCRVTAGERDAGASRRPLARRRRRDRAATRGA